MTNKRQSAIFHRKKVVGLNRQEYLDRKLNELCDDAVDESDAERNDGNENMPTNNDHNNGSWDADEIQPVVISVYTSDAPKEKNSTDELVDEELKQPKTATTEDNTLENATTTTEDSLDPPPVKDISVANNGWNDHDSLTIPTIEDNDDSSLGSLPSIDDDDNETNFDRRDDDNLSVIPLPVDVIWSDLYRNCGVETAEHVTDNLVVHLPRAVSRYFVWDDRKEVSKEEDDENNANGKPADRRCDETKITKGKTRQKKTARQKQTARGKDSLLVTVWKTSKDGRQAISDDYSEGMASF